MAKKLANPDEPGERDDNVNVSSDETTTVRRDDDVAVGVEHERIKPCLLEILAGTCTNANVVVFVFVVVAIADNPTRNRNIAFFIIMMCFC